MVLPGGTYFTGTRYVPARHKSEWSPVETAHTMGTLVNCEWQARCPYAPDSRQEGRLPRHVRSHQDASRAETDPVPVTDQQTAEPAVPLSPTQTYQLPHWRGKRPESPPSPTKRVSNHRRRPSSANPRTLTAAERIGAGGSQDARRSWSPSVSVARWAATRHRCPLGDRCINVDALHARQPGTRLVPTSAEQATSPH